MSAPMVRVGERYLMQLKRELAVFNKRVAIPKLGRALSMPEFTDLRAHIREFDGKDGRVVIIQEPKRPKKRGLFNWRADAELQQI